MSKKPIYSMDFDKVREALKIKSKTITPACIMKVEVGTNCPQGGDSGHGGRTYIKIANEGGVDWKIRVKDKDGEYVFEDVESLEILLGGDSECECIAKACNFMAKSLGFKEEFEKYLEDIEEHALRILWASDNTEKEKHAKAIVALLRVIEILRE